MKISRSLFLMLALTISGLPAKITAQELVQEGTQWNIHGVYWSFPPSEETISVKIEGDTLIANTLYKKIHESYDSLNAVWLERNDYIREDSNKKVYLLKNEEEHLLYDFNLVVGDTFPITYDAWEECNFLVVTQLDTIELTNGATRKRWKLENNASDFSFGFITYWTEGIGSHAGLLRYITQQGGCWEHYPYSLLCYYNDGEEIYSNNNEENCWQTLVSTKALNKGDGISVYPNPAKETVIIESKQANRIIKKAELYTSTGQLLEVLNINSEKGILNINGYQKGAYFLVIEDANGSRRSMKLIKLDF